MNPGTEYPPVIAAEQSQSSQEAAQMHLDSALVGMYLRAQGNPELQDILSRVMIGRAVVDYVVENAPIAIAIAQQQEQDSMYNMMTLATDRGKSKKSNLRLAA